MAAGVTGFLLGILVVADTFRPGGLLLPDGLELVLPMPFAIGSLIAVIYTLARRGPNRVPRDGLKQVFAEVPVAVRYGLNVVLAAGAIGGAFFMSAARFNHLALVRGCLCPVIVLSSFAAALAYGLHRLRRRGVDLL